MWLQREGTENSAEKPEKVAEPSYDLDTSYVYFIDRDGDVARVPRDGDDVSVPPTDAAIDRLERKDTVRRAQPLFMIHTDLEKIRLAVEAIASRPAVSSVQPDMGSLVKEISAELRSIGRIVLLAAVAVVGLVFHRFGCSP